jgi:hypothetical protein
MLSAKGKVCGNKAYILQKMQQLKDRLIGFKTEALNKLNLRVQQEATAKNAWLDEEGRYAVQKAAVELDTTNIDKSLKTVASLLDLVELRKARVSKVRADNTEALGEIDEEEAIIRELLGYIGDLTKSTVDVVFCQAFPSYQMLFDFVGAFGSNLSQLELVGQDVTSLYQKIHQGMSKFLSHRPDADPVLSSYMQ